LKMLSSILLTLITASVAVTAASIPRKRDNLATVYSSCKNPNQVALTFDDGPYLYLQNISDQLTNAGAKGTFFFNGNNWDCIYSPDVVTRVQYAYKAGHMIADHTWAHGDLTTFSQAQIVDSMYRMEEAFSRIIGIKPAFMRPPYGSYNDDVLEVAYDRNQSVVIWDTDTGDSDGATVAQSKQVYANAVSQKVSNMLVLNHETYNTTAYEVVPYAISLLQSHGYELVTLATCLDLKPYQEIGVPQSGSWSCDGTPAPGQGCSGNCESGTPPLSTGTGSTSATVTSTSTSPTSTATGVTIRPYASSTMCLSAATNKNGAAVELKTCTSTTVSSQWTLSNGNLVVYGNKCLDVTGGSTANGVKMQVYTCGSGNPNQQFTVTADKRIAWTGKGECLDLTGGSTASGNVAQMWKCTNNDNNQVWNLV
jgi:peptidoglycan/xylan/chitin deacetylase (PgdA/CDA1 family)